MTRVLVTYASTTGNTRRVAEAVAGGARAVPATDVVLLPVERVAGHDVAAADALIVGSPNHHQGPDSRVRRFAETVVVQLWSEGRLTGKVGAVFGTGGGFGSAGAGGELMLLDLVAPLAWSGMVIVPLPTSTPGFASGGLAWGPWARSSAPDMTAAQIDPEALVVAHHHGGNVARVAAQLAAGGPLFAAERPPGDTTGGDR